MSNLLLTYPASHPILNSKTPLEYAFYPTHFVVRLLSDCLSVL